MADCPLQHVAKNIKNKVIPIVKWMFDLKLILFNKQLIKKFRCNIFQNLKLADDKNSTKRYVLRKVLYRSFWHPHGTQSFVGVTALFREILVLILTKTKHLINSDVRNNPSKGSSESYCYSIFYKPFLIQFNRNLISMQLEYKCG